MTFALGSRAAERGYRVAAFDTLDSTNAEAMRRARAGDVGPLWIVVRDQTAGRGRRGREWQGTQDDLAASLLITLDVTPSIAATLGFVAGIAVHDALCHCAPGITLALKWPNDVLANGSKVAGILLESETVQGRLAVVTGIGVNVVSAPEDVPFPATSLRACGVSVTATSLLSQIADCWVDTFELWDGGRGMCEIVECWLARAAGRSGAISVRSGERTIEGIFERLDERGNLVVRTADGSPTSIAAGEVYFGNAATQRETL